MGLFNKSTGASSQRGGGLTVSNKFLKDARSSSDFILGAIDDGVMMFDRQYTVHLFNKAASNITGWAAAEAVGQNFNAIMPLVDSKGMVLPPEQHPFVQALIDGKPVRDNNVLISSKSGRQVAISVAISPIIEKPDVPPEMAIVVFRDVTLEKSQEQQRSDFISTASHEMRTPIAAIEGYLSLTLNPKITKIDDNARNYLEKARMATKHLGQLFADLLTSSKADDGRLSSNPVVVEIGEILEQVVEAEQFHAKQNNLELKYAVSSNKDVSGGRVVRPFYYCFVDPTRMNEVFQNIIDNAIKYTPQGSVTVKLTGDLNTVQIQVSDTGSGIPAEDIPHLFQKFYRVDSTATRTVGGTGLGLYICKKIVELYKGRVWVESQLGQGSTFFINLPRLTSEQALQMQKTQASMISPTVK